MKKLEIFLLFFLLPLSMLAQTTVGSGGTYGTLSEAFTAINEGNLTGAVELQIISSITETTTAVLYQPGYNGTSDYTSVKIYPDASGYIIDADIDGPLFDFNGATNITFDGRVGGTSPDIKDLTITNISTGSSASTIQFSESASGNIINFCIIKGSQTGSSGGVILFTTALVGIGNNGNTIDHNDITSYAAGRPVNAIFSLGTPGAENSGNIISSNNIFNFLNVGTASNGIFFSSNTTACTISGNSFYESTPFIPSTAVTYNVIKIDNTSGNGFTISGNFIGGRSPSCGGLAWTKTIASNNAFYAISLNVGAATPSDIQNNTIQNFNWANSGTAAWTGINVSNGSVNIGTTSGNIIGATTGNGSILVTGGNSPSIFYGIYLSGGGTISCRNNSIGSITVVNTLNAGNFYGIYKVSGSGTTTISNNTIGSTSTANSINASSPSTGATQNVYGINNSGTGSVTISSNTIANMINGTTNSAGATSGRIDGISSSTGPTIVSDNIIYNLSIANGNNTSTLSASVCGIVLIGNTTSKTVSGNKVYNLSNTYSSFTGSVIGIFFIGNTGANAVSENFIHDLTVANGSSANVYGIKISSGATTYSNNIISLGGTTTTNIYGIYETGAASNNNKIYFNTIYIGGSLGSGVNNSYALYSALTTNTRDFRNNIFINTRSTTGGLNLHYAMYIVSTGGTILCDYNDYYVSGTGGAIGYYGGVKTTLPIVTGQDVASLAINPVLANPGGTAATDYLPSASSLVAVTGTGITTDYAGVTRSVTYPAMGAWEYTVSPSWRWTGLTNTDWNTGTNWNYSTVPVSTNDVIIAPAGNNPTVNEVPATPAECKDLTINSGAILTIAAGKALRVNGILTNSAGVSGLVIKSDANGNDGKLINNTASVPGTVELFLKGGTVTSARVYHYFVPPVQSMAIGSDIASVKVSLGVTNFTGDLLSYSEVAAGANKDNGWQFFDGWNGTTGFSTIVSSAGYNVNFSADDKMTFTGNLNGAAHSFSSLSFTNQGWNLVGNPYPCNYDLSGITALTGTGDNVDNTVYFNHDGGYAFWNVELNAGTTGFSSIMPPMQGFFVHVTGMGTSLSLTVGSKTAGAAGPLRSKSLDISNSKGATAVKKIKLVLNNGITPDETIVCLVDNATPGFDSDYDAYKFFGSSNLPSIYTDFNSIKYALNSVHQPAETESLTIPVTVVLKSSGTYKIDISEFENLDGVNVVLKHGTDETILSKDVSYSFTSSAGTLTNFELIIGNKSISTAVEPVTNEKLKAWYNNRVMFINYPEGLAFEMSSMVIYDIQGKMVYNDKVSLTPGQIIEVPIDLPKGLYIVHVNISNQPVVTKIVVL